MVYEADKPTHKHRFHSNIESCQHYCVATRRLLGLGYNGAMSSVTKTSPTENAKKNKWVHLTILGVSLTVFGLWLGLTPSGLLGKADAIGYSVCHRIDLRSFHLGDRPLPLCARCTGMYLGALLALIFHAVRKPRAGHFPPRRLMVIFALFGLIWAIDGLNSVAYLFPSAPSLYQPSNTLRMITGTLVGVALATLIYPVFNQSMWREWKPVPVLQSVGELIFLLILAAVVVIAVVIENVLILYPLALLSGVSVLVLLTLVYSTLLVTVIRRDNQADIWRDLTLPLSLGFIMAVLQIALVSAGRSYLLGGSGLYL